MTTDRTDNETLARAAVAYREDMRGKGVELTLTQAVRKVMDGGAPAAFAEGAYGAIDRADPEDVARAAVAYREDMRSKGVELTLTQAVRRVIDGRAATGAGRKRGSAADYLRELVAKPLREALAGSR